MSDADNSIGGAVYAEVGGLLSQIHHVGDSPALFNPNATNTKKKENVDGERSAWTQGDRARCDFATIPNLRHNDTHYFTARWKRTRVGRTLGEIKADESMVGFFAEEMAALIRSCLGTSLALGDFAIVTSPKRRHKERNFATLVAAAIADMLGVPFHEDVCSAPTRKRVGAQFSLNYLPPERNIIVFDDFVTTGSTFISMYNLFQPLGKNLVFFTAVNNKS